MVGFVIFPQACLFLLTPSPSLSRGADTKKNKHRQLPPGRGRRLLPSPPLSAASPVGRSYGHRHLCFHIIRGLCLSLLPPLSATSSFLLPPFAAVPCARRSFWLPQSVSPSSASGVCAGSLPVRSASIFVAGGGGGGGFSRVIPPLRGSATWVILRLLISPSYARCGRPIFVFCFTAGMGGSGIVEVVNSKGCSRLFVAAPASLPPVSLPSLNSPRSSCLMSPSSMAVSEAGGGFPRTSLAGPFSGLIICVTGLSKEARKQVMDATERLGEYSFGGRKFEHALKHGLKSGLSVVTLSWFIDSVRRNARMREALYAVKNFGENGLPLQEIGHLVSHQSSNKSCLPAHEGSNRSSMIWQPHLQTSEKETIRNRGSLLASKVIYIDSNISNELKKKVVDAAFREGATFMDQWFVGCQASHVVCEGSYIHKYIGHANNLVTPMWILKSVKENYVHRLVHLSSDLARHVAVALENVQMSVTEQRIYIASLGGVEVLCFQILDEHLCYPIAVGNACAYVYLTFFRDIHLLAAVLLSQDASAQNAHQAAECTRESLIRQNNRRSLEERQKIVDMAKMGVRNRRSHRLQSYQMTIRLITPVSLLDSICWSISEPASSACIYMDRHGKDDDDESCAPVFLNTPAGKRDLDVSFNNFSRPLKESEKREIVFKNHFMTILFPIDRFGELGPSSRTFFSEGGFTCLQVLEHIYNFYQENLTAEEIDVAIHTDSKHADSLRSLYASKEVVNPGLMQFKRVDFLGSRRSFEVLKRVSGETNFNVYELMIRA
ncbi:hypothetical protein Taro_012411 [Colocasia esculenta]|uniref:BRCT domain-containing protein n=1 Tax=Colocasia esculenta TaxID=4460 RepID=A0A843U3Y3_COLES|nr:hypothetical protein [Colocasia esculenta]